MPLYRYRFTDYDAAADGFIRPARNLGTGTNFPNAELLDGATQKPDWALQAGDTGLRSVRALFLVILR